MKIATVQQPCEERATAFHPGTSTASWFRCISTWIQLQHFRSFFILACQPQIFHQIIQEGYECEVQLPKYVTTSQSHLWVADGIMNQKT